MKSIVIGTTVVATLIEIVDEVGTGIEMVGEAALVVETVGQEVVSTEMGVARIVVRACLVVGPAMHSTH